MASEMKGRNTLDQVKAFNKAAHEYLNKSSDRNLDEVEKILTVLTQVNNSEVWDLSKIDIRDLVLNTAQLLNSLEYKNNVTWSLINLLSKVADISRSPQLREGYQLVPVLSRILHSLPSTTHKRTITLLELLQVLVQDFEVVSIESYLITLVKDLYDFISGDDPRTGYLAAFILSSLLRKNILVVKMVVMHCPIGEFAALRRGEDNHTSLILETIAFRLEQANLSSSAPPLSAVMKILSKMSSTVSQAFQEENIIIFKFFTNFIQDISECIKWGSVLKELDPMDVLSEILSIPQFDRNSPLLWEFYFGFLETLVNSISGDRLMIFNKVVKVVILRLEVKPYSEVTNALSLFITALQGVVKEELTSADRVNLKYLVDQALPCLKTVYSSSVASTTDRDCFCTCLRLYNLLASLDLATSLQCDSMMTVFKKGFSGCTRPELKSQMIVEFLNLTGLLAPNSSGWAKLKKDLMANKEYLEAVGHVLGSQEHSSDTVKKAVALINPNPELFLQNWDQTTPRPDRKVAPLYPGNYLGLEDAQKLEDSIDELRLAASRLCLDEEERILPKVLEMQNYLGHKEQAQIRALKGDLEAADERLKNKNWIIENLSQELEVTKSLLGALSARYSTARLELQIIKTQHNSTSKDAEQRITELTANLQDTEARLSTEKEISERLTGENESIKSELELSIKEREALDQKLKEARTAVSKRDDKLKRTMRQLEEEQSKREDIEKKHEKLSKSHASLDTLCKNQEEAFKRKEKALEECQNELHSLKAMRDAIFNLSKSTATAGSG